MPRRARILSESKFDHVMLRGVNRQIIFEDDEDCGYFLNLLKRFKEECGFVLPGYCLMGNHVHLLIGVRDTELQTVMKKVETAYVYYFNMKYGRTGHLFQDRYRSEPIRNDEQLLTALRYIHRNPVKAGICSKCADYDYSSYKEYLSDSWNYADGSMIFDMIGNDQFFKYTEEDNEDQCLEAQETVVYRKTDQDAKRIMKEVSGGKTATEFQTQDKKERNLSIKKMYDSGLSVTQICRLTGVSRGTVSRNIR